MAMEAMRQGYREVMDAENLGWLATRLKLRKALRSLDAERTPGMTFF